MKLPWGMNVKHVYLAFFSLISIALCAFCLLIHAQYVKVQNLNEYTRYQDENIRQSQIILMDVVALESAVRGYVISKDETFLDPYRRSDSRLRDEIYALRSATYYESNAFGESSAWLDQIEALQKVFDNQVERVKIYGRGAIDDKELATERAMMDRLRNRIEASIVKRKSDMKLRTDLVGVQKNNFIYTLIIGCIVGVGILLSGTVLIIRLESETRTFEEEQIQAEQRFRAVMNGINDGLYELNFINETMYMSRKFKDMLGYSDDELDNSAHALTALIHPDDVEHALEVRRKYITLETPVYNNVFRLRHKDGTWRWVLSRGVGTWDKFGQIRSMTGTHTDITEQKSREEELRQLNADMEAFTYITSHDMRSPLVNLKGFSHELKLAVTEVNNLLEPQAKKLGKAWDRLDTILKAEIPEALGFIGNAVDRMDTLTTAILDLSRIGKFTYRDIKVDSQAIFDKCLGAQSYEISEKKVKVSCTSLPVLVADPVALEQIFSNLLDNAVKYLRADVPGEISVSCRETGRDYVFTFRDNGRGIGPEDSDRVFHIFRRARNTGDVRGLGLGMAFVKATLRKMSGAIWFDSAVDAGTTFYVSLPRKAPTDKMSIREREKADA